MRDFPRIVLCQTSFEIPGHADVVAVRKVAAYEEKTYFMQGMTVY